MLFLATETLWSNLSCSLPIASAGNTISSTESRSQQQPLQKQWERTNCCSIWAAPWRQPQKYPSTTAQWIPSAHVMPAHTMPSNAAFPNECTPDFFLFFSQCVHPQTSIYYNTELIRAAWRRLDAPMNQSCIHRSAHRWYQKGSNSSVPLACGKLPVVHCLDLAALWQRNSIKLPWCMRIRSCLCLKYNM